MVDRHGGVRLVAGHALADGVDEHASATIAETSTMRADSRSATREIPSGAFQAPIQIT